MEAPGWHTVSSSSFHLCYHWSYFIKPSTFTFHSEMPAEVFTLIKRHQSVLHSLLEHVVLFILWAHLHCCTEQNGQFSFCKPAIQISNRLSFFLYIFFFPELQLLQALFFTGLLLCWIRNNDAWPLKVEPCVLLTLWKTMPSVTWFRSVV